MTAPDPETPTSLRRRIFSPGDASAGPPRERMSPEDRRTFLIFLVVAFGLVFAGLAYAYLGL